MDERRSLSNSAKLPKDPPAMLPPLLEARELHVFAGSKTLLRRVDLTIHEHQVFGIIGPSGAGKSTLLRCLNRLIELDSTLIVQGEVLYRGQSIFAPGTDVDHLRAQIGIIFQQPVIFPTSIYKNVLFGVRHLGRVQRSEWPLLVERALREAALWTEVEDRLHEPAQHLSVGQQQRLCLARTLAVDPEIILMDEPTSSLDAKSAEAIEDLILHLKERRTVVLVTHNLDQARRVGDWVACINTRDGAGEIVDTGRCSEVLGRYEGMKLKIKSASKES